uniref:Putative reverse transcriptase n=1 Tax=Ixodes ricinus TaxID=34613 RepID=A0A0K8R538_IXORI
MQMTLPFFFSADTCDELIDMTNFTLLNIKGWGDSNSLKININKTKAVIFRPKHKSLAISKVLRFDSSPIEIVSCYKTLGVFFSETMSWDNHINYIVSKLARVLGL